MLTPFGPEIWCLEGDPVVVMGFRYPTRAVVIRLASGDLWVCSPVGLNDEMRAQLAALGPVRHIVAPNSLHHLSLPQWAAAYRDTRIHAPPGLREKRADIRFDDDLGDRPNPDWADEIDQVVMRGNRITSEVVFFHKASRTVLFTDLLQQFPPGWFSGWRRIVARLDLMIGPEPRVPRKFRLAFSDRKAARAALQRILDWPAERVIMAHGAPVTQDGRAFLLRAFSWLDR